MTLFITLLLAVTPASGLDLPPEAIWAAGLVPPVATQTAERGTVVQMTETSPPPTTQPSQPTFDSASSNGRCVGAEPLLSAYSPGWDVGRMSRIMYRESRCQPGARNTSSSATGLLQILSSHCGWLSDQMDTWCTRDRLTDPYFNIRAAATLWRAQGYSAWSTS